MQSEKLQGIREQFPFVGDKVYGKDLVYLDNSATTQRPKCVIDKLVDSYYHIDANIHRGVHFLSQRATEAHELARTDIAKFINAPSNKEVLFTRGTTESINLLAFCFGETFLRNRSHSDVVDYSVGVKGCLCNSSDITEDDFDEILISGMEHHSNIIPWQLLCQRKKLKIRVIPINDKGELLMDEYEKLLTPRVKLVSITHVSNVLGTVNPIKKIISLAHNKGIPVMVDAAQSIAHMKIDVQDLDVDFLAFSSHKIYGPTGIGSLYAKAKFLEKFPPYQGGGEMIMNASYDSTTWNELPYKFEAGTPDFIGSVAFGEAIRFVSSIGIDLIHEHEKNLLEYATSEIKKIEGIKIYGQASEKSGVLSFNYKDSHPFDVGTLLDHLGIAVRTGHHCAEPLMSRFGITGTVRASFALYNNFSDVDVFIKGLKRVVKML